MPLETDMVAELVEATQNGSWQDVERLLSKQITAAAAFDVNQFHSDIGGTLLHEASRQGHARIARLLINHGASVYIMDEFGETPFHIASKNGHIQVGCLLLDHGAEPYWYNEIGRTALEDSKDCITEQALKEHYEKLQHGAMKKRLKSSSASGVRHILPRNDSLNDFLSEENSRNTSQSDILVDQGAGEEQALDFQDIIQATMDGKVDIVRKLLDENVDNVNKHYDDEAGTLLHIACRRNQVDVAKLLLEMGATAGINSLNGEGLTALHIASELGFSDLIKLLLDHNADVMIQDPDCRTPFDIAKDDATLRVLLNRTRELDVGVVSVLDHVTEQEKQSTFNEAAEVEETDTESTTTDGYYAKFDLLMQQRHEELQAIIGKLQNDVTLLREKDEQRQEEFEALQAVVTSLEEQVNEQKQNTNSCEQNSKLIREQSMDLEDLEERLARVEDGLQEAQLNLVLQQQQQPQQLQKQKQQQQAQQDDELPKQKEQMTPEETGLLEAENTLLKVENENQKLEIALLRMKVAEYAQMEQEQEAHQKKQEKQKEKEKQEKQKEKERQEKQKQKDHLLINLNSSIHDIKPFEKKVFDEPRPEYEDDDNENEHVNNKKLLGFSIDNGKSLLFSFPDFFGEAEEKEKKKAQADLDCARKTPDQSMVEGGGSGVEV